MTLDSIAFILEKNECRGVPFIPSEVVDTELSVGIPLNNVSTTIGNYGTKFILFNTREEARETSYTEQELNSITEFRHRNSHNPNALGTISSVIKYKDK